MMPSQGHSLDMYKLTFSHEDEEFDVWRLAVDSEDAAWQANRISVDSNWTLIDVILDEKEKTSILS